MMKKDLPLAKNVNRDTTALLRVARNALRALCEAATRPLKSAFHATKAGIKGKKRRRPAFPACPAGTRPSSTAQNASCALPILLPMTPI